jgi:hypothetical protein
MLIQNVVSLRNYLQDVTVKILDSLIVQYFYFKIRRFRYRNAQNSDSYSK